MADKSVGELIAAQSVTPTDLFVLEQNGTAKKLTGQILENWLVSFADGHGGIQSIKKLSTSGLVDTYRITLADTTTFDFVVTNGRSITGISKTSTSGLVDTYTITYNNGPTSTFTVKNGEKGDKGDNTYTWVKYASQEPTESSHSIGDIPDDWIGIYSGNASTAPTDWKQYKWYKIKGKQGDTGAAATLVNKSVTYQVGDSGTIIPSGTWVNSVPVVSQGKYLWTKTELQFNTGDPIVFYSVARIGLDGSGSVSMVNNVSPDSDGNVKLTSADVGALPSSGGDMTGAINMNGQKISGLNDPTESTEAVRKGYVDGAVKKAAPWNLLDNSDFTNPVNQRGLKNYSGNVYTIDRWRIGNSYSACTVGNDYVLYSASGGTSYPRQIIKPTVAMGGKTFTAAVCTRGGLMAITSGVFPAKTVSATTVFAPAVTISEGVTLVLRKATDGTIDFMFQINDGKSLTLRWAALYEGEYTLDTLPEYQTKGYGAELQECRRYYYRILGNKKWIATGAAVNTNEVRIPIKLPTAMRIFPTVTIADSAQTRIKAAEKSSAAPSAISWAAGNEACNDIMIMNATLAGAAGGDVCTLYLDNNGLIEFSADL